MGRGTAYGLVADVAAVISALIVSIVVARFLGPAHRGVYALALLVATLVSLLGDFGLSTSGIVYAANRRVPLKRLHGTALALSLACALVGGALLLVFDDWLTGHVLKGVGRGELWLVAVGVVPTLYTQVVSAMLTGMGRLGVLSALRTVAAIGAPIVMVPAVWASGGSAFWAVVGWLGGTIVLAVPMAWVATREMGVPALPSPAQVRLLMGFGLRAYVGTVSHHGFLRIDTLLISARSGPADVGQYSLSSILAERISLVGSAVYGASATHIGGGERQAAEDLVARLVRLLVLVLVPVAALLAALAWPLIPLAFGADYRPAVEPFVLLLPGTVSLTIWYVLSLYVLATLNRPGATTLIQGAALIVSLPLYWVAIDAWGMIGAAIVSSGVYVSVMAAGAAVFLRNRQSAASRLLPGPADVRDGARIARAALARLRGSDRHA